MTSALMSVRSASGCGPAGRASARRRIAAEWPTSAVAPFNELTVFQFARSVTSASVDGKTHPRAFNSRLGSSIASAKLPVI
jgi:hypothetical protein